MSKVSSSDIDYQLGMLSIYPSAIDNKEILYEAKNNAETYMIQSISATSKIIVVDDTTLFPDNGLIRIGPPAGKPGNAELIYYGKKTKNTFQSIIRGFAGSRQTRWNKGSYVTSAVMADHHNAVKDALINIENNIGTKEDPEEESLNWILKKQEIRFLSPKPLFRAFPRTGNAPLKVRFQNFTAGDLIKYLWDFGDGSTSLEESPIHTYQNEGSYSVKLTITTSTGGTGLVIKKDYILVDNNLVNPFFYVKPSLEKYSVQTAARLGKTPTEFTFVDQTDGDIVQRNWVFGDGEKIVINNPNQHTVNYIFSKPSPPEGYPITLLVVFADDTTQIVNLPDNLIVL